MPDLVQINPFRTFFFFFCLSPPSLFSPCNAFFGRQSPLVPSAHSLAPPVFLTSFVSLARSHPTGNLCRRLHGRAALTPGSTVSMPSAPCFHPFPRPRGVSTASSHQPALRLLWEPWFFGASGPATPSPRRRDWYGTNAARINPAGDMGGGGTASLPRRQHRLEQISVKWAT